MHQHTTRSLTGPNRTILVVVEEPTIRELLAVNLRNAGFFPVLAATSQDGRRLVGEVRPDVVLIDLDSEATADGSFATDLRRGDRFEAAVPTVMVTSRMDAVCGASREVCGATLCIGKPYAPRELVGRIVQQLRPARRPAKKRALRRSLRVGPLELDAGRQAATIHRHGLEEGVGLAPIELKLLRCLMEHPDRTQTRAEIVQEVWGTDQSVDDRTVDQYVKRLRAALEPIGAAGMIKTVRGFGYRLDALTLQRQQPRE